VQAAGAVDPIAAQEAAPEGASDVAAAEAADTDDEIEDVEAEGIAAADTNAQAVIVPPPDPHDNTPRIEPVPQAKPRARRRPRPTPAVAPEPQSDLSVSDKKILDEFGSGTHAAPAKIDLQDSGSTQSKKPPLDGDGVRATVTKNKPRLQRCYERAIRGQQSPPAVRLDVEVMVSASGRVKDVTSEGSGPGGLAECVEASVRRWRFPESAEGGPARFPIVFSAN
jgi:hypothetical protein